MINSHRWHIATAAAILTMLAGSTAVPAAASTTVLATADQAGPEQEFPAVCRARLKLRPLAAHGIVCKSGCHGRSRCDMPTVRCPL